MQIDKNLISRLEHLARLELSKTEREQMLLELNNILAMVEKLKELPTDSVEPLIYLSEGKGLWRADEVQNQLDREKALENAPDPKTPYFRVPKVIDLK